jgi:hypothetical protein
LRQPTCCEFRTSLNKAKADSIRRNAKIGSAKAFVSIINDHEYSISADFDRDGTLEANETMFKRLPNSRGEKFLLSSTNYPIKISFDWRGRATATDNTGTAVAAVSYCSKDCPANLANANSNNKSIFSLTISPLGDTQLYQSAISSASTVTPPTISSVSQNANIRTGTNINAL